MAKTRPIKKGASTMSSQPSRPQDSPSPNEIEVCALYRQLLDGWNKRNANAFAALCIEDGDIVGFDGSQMTGQAEMASTLRHIFTCHPTAAYVTKLRTF